MRATLPHRQVGRLPRLRFQSARAEGQERPVHRQGGRRLAEPGGRSAPGRPDNRGERDRHRERDPQSGGRAHQGIPQRDQAASGRPGGRRLLQGEQYHHQGHHAQHQGYQDAGEESQQRRRSLRRQQLLSRRGE